MGKIDLSLLRSISSPTWCLRLSQLTLWETKGGFMGWFWSRTKFILKGEANVVNYILSQLCDFRYHLGVIDDGNPVISFQLYQGDLISTHFLRKSLGIKFSIKDSQSICEIRNCLLGVDQDCYSKIIILGEDLYGSKTLNFRVFFLFL